MGGRRSRGGSRYVALLRGVNVGGNNKLLMKDLVEIFQTVGCSEVQSYIQSGNIIFSAGPILARRAPAMISATIQQRFGFSVPIVVRSATELEALVKANPFRSRDAEALHLMCLMDTPDMARVAELDIKRSEPDAFALCGPNIFLYLPNGSAKTKLNTSYFDRALGTTSTGRNWKTIETLIELTRG